MTLKQAIQLMKWIKWCPIIRKCIAECLKISSEHMYFSDMDIEIDNICYGYVIGYILTTTNAIDSVSKELQIKFEQHFSLTVVKVKTNKLYEGKTRNNDMWQLDNIKEYVDTISTSIKGLNGKTTIIMMLIWMILYWA